jgi:hypothetical protein
LPYTEINQGNKMPGGNSLNFAKDSDVNVFGNSVKALSLNPQEEAEKKMS